MAKISEKEKTLKMESIVLKGSVEEIIAASNEIGPIEFSARALGMACRFRGLEVVKTLVELGFHFSYYDYRKPHLVSKYDCGYTTASGYKIRSDFKLMLLDNCTCISNIFLDRGYKNREGNYLDEDYKQLSIVSEAERAEIIDYLYEHRKETWFDASEMLYYSILSLSDFAIERLKLHGVTIPKDKRCFITNGGRGLEFDDYQKSLCKSDANSLYKQLRYWIGEIGPDEKLLIYKSYAEKYANSIFAPNVYALIRERADLSKISKKTILQILVESNNESAVSMLCDDGWISDKAQRDNLIKLASEKKSIETAAVLIEYKNKTSDLLQELDEEEKRIEHELNLSSNSVEYLKKQWTYEKLEDGTLCLKKYKGNDTHIIIPEKIGKAIVSTIGFRLFSPYPYDWRDRKLKPEEIEIRRNIESVYIPDTVTTIKEEAFSECENLKSCELPSNLQFLGKRAFEKTRLESVCIPDSLKQLQDYVYEQCHALKQVDLGKGLEIIGRAFYNCSALEKVVFGENVNEIENYAFDGTPWIEHLTEEDIIAGKFKVGYYNGNPVVIDRNKE